MCVCDFFLASSFSHTLRFFSHFRFKCFSFFFLSEFRVYFRSIFSPFAVRFVGVFLFAIAIAIAIDVSVYALHYTSACIHIINRPQSVLCVMKIYVIFEINLCLQCYFVR